MMINSIPKIQIPKQILPWLDVLAITSWGILLMKYWLTGKLNLLIHPDYFWLVIITSISFLILGILKSVELINKNSNVTNPADQTPPMQHINFFTPGVSSILLITVAIIGLLITPKVFASQTAIQRGVTESVTLTRSKPQQFRTSSKPEERSLVDWVRTLNVYPEPDAYTGQKVKVQGFVVHSAELPAQYLLLSKFVITCCAADAYPVGIPVKLTENRGTYAPDSWLEIEGIMITEDLANKRQLTIQANSIKKISAPENPYDY